MINHRTGFLSIVLRDNKYVPGAFHFLPWDYVVLNAEEFKTLRDALVKTKQQDQGFRLAITSDLKRSGKQKTEANENFLIEEIVVSHLIAQKKIPLPHTLATSNGWRLICYPGNPLISWVYAHQSNLLSKRADIPRDQVRLSRSFYNMDKRILINLDSSELEKIK